MRSAILIGGVAILSGALAMAEGLPRALPPQPLADALDTFAKLSGLQVIYRAELAAGLNSKGSQAGLPAEEALRELLRDTGLTYTFVNDRMVAIRSASKAGESRTDALKSVNDDASKTAGLQLARADETADRRLAEAANGQDTSARTAGQAADDKLQEIVVTAQKRAERLIDIPQAVSVLSADYLARIGAVRFRDFANTVPGLNFATRGNGAVVSLRGVTTGGDISPTVGIYIDDVPYGSSTSFAAASPTALDVALFDLDRVEVLRGPQGTLYGAATMGGLVKYVSKRPDTGRLNGDAYAGISSTENGGVNYDVAAAVNAPLAADKLAIRASGYQSRDGGFIDNVAAGRKNVDRSNTYGGRVDLWYTPTDDLTVRVGAFLQNVARDGTLAADFTRAGAPLIGDLDQRRLYPELFDQTFRLISGVVTYDLGPAAVTSISSYQTVRSRYSADGSPSYLPIFTNPPFNFPYSAVGALEKSNVDKFTQEVRIASAGTHTIEWLLGGYYTREDADKTNTLPTLDLAGQPIANNLAFLFIPSRYEDLAGFADLTYRLTGKLDFTGGVRYVQNDQTVAQAGSGLLAQPRPKRSATDSVFTYLGNVRYHFSGNAIGYLRYATGYRPGGPNIVLNDAVTGLPLAQPTFDADRLSSYEVGFKAETPGRTFSIDIAAYSVDWADIQIAATRNNVGVRTNAGDARIRGAELALTAHPVRAFTMTGALAYIDAHLAEAFPDQRGLEGERLPNVPRFSASLNADYELSPGTLRPTVGATLRHVSDRMTSFNNSVTNPQYRLPAYTMLDLRSAVTLGTIGVQLYVHNLLDKRGQLSGVAVAGVENVSIVQPRTIGIAATTHF